jgi:signal peptidase
MKDRHTSHRSRLLTGLLLAAGVAVLAAGIGFRVADLHVQTVLSGSMRPTVSPGDLAITQGVLISSLRVGDVIAFTPPNESQAVLHRIATLQDGAITTRGDANNVDDSWRATLAGTDAYRLAFVVPFLGWLTELRSAALIAAGLIVALLILLEIRKGVGVRKAQAA